MCTGTEREESDAHLVCPAKLDVVDNNGPASIARFLHFSDEYVQGQTNRCAWGRETKREGGKERERETDSFHVKVRVRASK